MIKFYFKSISDKEVKTLDNFKVGSWIHVEKPSKEELEILEKDFLLDSGLLRDALDPFEVPRVERDEDIVYIYTTFPMSEDGDRKILTVPLLIAMGSNFVATITDKPLPFLKKFSF